MLPLPPLTELSPVEAWATAALLMLAVSVAEIEVVQPLQPIEPLLSKAELSRFIDVSPAERLFRNATKASESNRFTLTTFTTLAVATASPVSITFGVVEASSVLVAELPPVEASEITAVVVVAALTTDAVVVETSGVVVAFKSGVLVATGSDEEAVEVEPVVS